MTITKRILMLMATSCLIVLLAASFVMAGEMKLPSDETLLNTIQKDKTWAKALKGGRLGGKFKDDNGSYLLFFYFKGGNGFDVPVRLYPLESGKWNLAVYGSSTTSFLIIE
ncbi:hypothetical protein ACFLZI_01790 [Nitrospirota bacterium]